jgi:hypothetical protein
MKKSVLYQSTVTSVPATFSKANGKGKPKLATTLSTVHATITDVRTLLTTQTRPISSDGIMSLFKSDPQKKLDKEQNAKVYKSTSLQSICANIPRFKPFSNAYMTVDIRV